MGFGWGIFGASFATVLAQLIAFLLCLRSLRRLPFVQLAKVDWKTDPAILLHLCRLGIPTGLQMSMITLGGMVLQSVLNGFGVVFLAGYTAANKLYGILESASVAFGYAMTAYMGQNRGARNAARIDTGIRAVLALSAGFTAAIVTAMLLAGKPLLGLFLSTEEAGAADALAVAYQYLMVLMAFFYMLNLPFGMLTLLIGHTVFCIPYILMEVKARLVGMDPSLEEAARDLGATSMRAFLDVTLPLIMPAVASGSLLAFAMSMDDVVISIFINGPRLSTLPIKVYTQIKTGVTPEINALCTIMLAFTVVILLVYSLIKKLKRKYK